MMFGVEGMIRPPQQEMKESSLTADFLTQIGNACENVDLAKAAVDEGGKVMAYGNAEKSLILAGQILAQGLKEGEVVKGQDGQKIYKATVCSEELAYSPTVVPEHVHVESSDMNERGREINSQVANFDFRIKVENIFPEDKKFMAAKVISVVENVFQGRPVEDPENKSEKE